MIMHMRCCVPLQSLETALSRHHTYWFTWFFVLWVRKKQVSMKFVDSMMIEIWAKKMVNPEQIIARSLEGKNEWMWRLLSIFVAYYGPILCHIAELLIMLSWGSSQMATSRWAIDMPRLQAESTRLDFDQIIPLALLVLPLLAAMEIFHGKLAPRTTFMY